MYTRQATAVLDSLRNITGDDESAQALQAFANCNASLSHRGPVRLSSQQFPNRGGVMRPQGNGGGVSGVSRAGPAGGPGQALRGGVWVPDKTQMAPPWAMGNGVGSGMFYPASNFYGGSYYGAGAQGNDLGYGQPSTAYMTQLDGGGDYYDNTSQFGGGDIFNQIQEGNVFIDMSSSGGNYTSNWNTVTNNSFITFPGPTITNNSTYNYGGDTFVVEGDTIINNTTITPTLPGGGGMGGFGPQGPPGDPGGAGPAGPPGMNGAPGQDGGVIVIGAPGAGGGNQNQVRIKLRYVNGLVVRPQFAVDRVLTSATLNAEACSVDTTEKAIFYLTGVAIEPQFNEIVVLGP